MINVKNPSLFAGVLIGSPIKLSTPGSVLFIDASGNLAQNNANLFWDNTNNRLGIGTTSPGGPLDVSAAAASLVRLGAFLTPSMSNSQKNYIEIGSAVTNNNGFYLQYNHDSSQTSRYLGIQSNELSGGAGLSIVANGYVAVGTATPQTNFTVQGVGAASKGQIQIIDTGATAAGNSSIGAGMTIFGSDVGSSSTGRIGFIGKSSGAGAEFLVYNQNNTPLAFYTNATEYMRISATGNVGIGTTAPGQSVAGGSGNIAGLALHIKSATTDSSLVFEGKTNSNLDFITNNSGVNKKFVQFNNGATDGIALFRGIKDDLSAVTFNILAMDLGTGNVGIGITVPTSILHVAGPITTALSTKTANYIITATDSVILVNAASNAVTITLPTAVGIAGIMYTVKRTDSSANQVTVNTTSSQTIDGSTSVGIGTQYNSLNLVSDGANWIIT